MDNEDVGDDAAVVAEMHGTLLVNFVVIWGIADRGVGKGDDGGVP